MNVFKKIGEFIGDAIECAEAVKALANSIRTTYINMVAATRGDIERKMRYGSDLRAYSQSIADLQTEIEHATNRTHVGAPQCCEALEKTRFKLSQAIVELEGLLEQFNNDL